MFIDINEYKKIVKEKRELLERQCDSATSHPEYAQYVVDYRMYHAQLLDSIKKAIRNTKITSGVAILTIGVFLTECAYFCIVSYTVVHLLYIPLFFALLYIYHIADKELAELICVYEKGV